METLYQQSIDLTFWLQSLGAWLSPIMHFFTFLGDEEFYLFVMPLFVWVIDYKRGIKLGVMLLLTSAINDVTKKIFRLPRPFWLNPQASERMTAVGGYGFPSGHSQTAMSIFGLLAVEFKKRWLTILMGFVIVMIGLSRIFLGVHFTIDVLVGWALGAIMLFGFVKLSPVVATWFSDKPLSTKLGAMFALSLFMVLITAIVVAIPQGYELPQTWVDNAAIVSAEPDEPLNPLSLSSVLTSAGTLFGLTFGFFWVEVRGGFNANSGEMWQRAARFVVGVVGVLIIYAGLGALFPSEPNLLGWSLRYLRYALIGVWISGVAPLIFVRLKLATTEA